MGIQTIPVTEWNQFQVRLDSDNRWLGIGPRGSRLESVAAELCSEEGELDEGVAILRRGVVGRTAEILNQLPAAVTTFAVPVSAADWVLVPLSAANSLRPTMEGQPWSESVFRLATEHADFRWHAVPLDAVDDAAALPALTPGRPSTDNRWQWPALPQVLAMQPRSESKTESQALAAAVLQLSDWLDESHQASQSIEGTGRDRNGDYWHAIMHRREPDYGNAKYWFRHVGRHPIFPALMEAAGEVLGAGPVDIAQEWRKRLIARGQWEPFAFVDLCEQARRDESSPLGLTARRIQFLEMLLLLRHTWG